MIFYLGTHKPVWLERTTVPLFISSRAFIEHRQKRSPRARGPWALDSGAYTELRRHGRWTYTAAEYAERIRERADEVSGLRWAAPMDWPCEASVLRRTGLTVREHQERTIANFLALRLMLGPLVIPVLQGWTPAEYLRCIELYRDVGVDLTAEPLVGIGSICRRGQDDVIVGIVYALYRRGLRLHAFGVRSRALKLCAGLLASADSLAWSARARRDKPMPGHTHKACSNCMPYALRWRDRQLDRLGFYALLDGGGAVA